MRMYLHTKVWHILVVHTRGGSTVGACQWGGSGEHVRARSQEIRGHRVQPSLGVGRCIAVQGVQLYAMRNA